jgi:hypothetical protein
VASQSIESFRARVNGKWLSSDTIYLSKKLLSTLELAKEIKILNKILIFKKNELLSLHKLVRLWAMRREGGKICDWPRD